MATRDAIESPRSSERSKSIVNSVLRACRILELLSREGPELSLAHIAEQEGLSRPTAHRLLSTLVEAGWVQRRAAGRYALTMRVFSVGAAASTLPLTDIAKPIVSSLAQTTGDTAYLMVPSEGMALCVERIDGPYPVRVHRVGVGDLTPLLSGAAPIAMVAFQPDLLMTAIDKRTATMPGLADKMTMARRDGVVVSLDDLVPGVTAVGSPVLGADGALVGGISVTGTNDRYSGEHRERAVRLVRQAAVDLSVLLGHSGDLTAVE